MKKFIIAALALVGVGCSAEPDINNTPAATTLDKIYAFTDVQTRSELDWENGLPVGKWSVEDAIALFDGTTDKLKYTYNGESAEADGEFVADANNPAKNGAAIANAYAYFPYENVTSVSANSISAVLPETQVFYKSGSYGQASNAMLAVEQIGADNYSFKNLVGYIMITLTGSDVVKSITLSSNSSTDKLAGEFTVNPATLATTMGDDAVNYVTIDCGEGVQLTNDGTSFVFALPTTAMEKGFSITAFNTDGKFYTISTTRAIEVKRNVITPMDPIEATFNSNVAANEFVYFASSDISSTITADDFENPFLCEMLKNEYNPATKMGRVTFASTSDGYTITGINANAFKGITELTNICFSANTKNIHASAFEGCTGLKSIVFPKREDENTIDIGQKAFYGCSQLEEVEFHDIYIYSEAFANCPSLSKITFNAWQYIHARAFYNTQPMTVVLNSNPCYIATAEDTTNKYWYWEAFGPKRDGLNFECNGFNSAQITYTPGWEDYFAVGSKSFNAKNSITYTTSDYKKPSLWSYYFLQYISNNGVDTPFSDIVTDWYMPDPDGVLGVTGFVGCQYDIHIIATNAFKNSKITSITLPEDLIGIEASAFENCSELTEITIPSKVWSLEQNAFKDCTKLKTITFTHPTSTVYSWSSTIFSNCTSLNTIRVPRGYKNTYSAILANALENIQNCTIVEY